MGQAMRHGRGLLALAALLTAISVASEASAGSRPAPAIGGPSWSNRNVSIETVVEFGNNPQPVTIVENSRINIARVIEIGPGTVDATIVQNGTRNYVDVIQVGKIGRAHV